MIRFLILSFFVAFLLNPISVFANDFRNLNSCSRPIVPVDEYFGQDWDFNAMNVSLSYSLFSALSADTYSKSVEEYRFVSTRLLERVGLKMFNWVGEKTGARSHRFRSSVSGLVFDSYTKETDDCVFLIIAIRGTDFYSISDWYSNFSWFTGLVPIGNQYKQIDNQFVLLAKAAKKKYAGKSIKFIATGHSLGGGLANHLAKCFANVSAVTFNSSFVHNSLGCAKYKTNIVEIYDKEEVLTSVRNIVGRGYGDQKNNDHISSYGINPIALGSSHRIKQHSMDAMALAMLRGPIECSISKDKCFMSKSLLEDNIKVSKIILCDNFWERTGRGSDFSDVCVLH